MTNSSFKQGTTIETDLRDGEALRAALPSRAVWVTNSGKDMTVIRSGLTIRAWPKRDERMTKNCHVSIGSRTTIVRDLEIRLGERVQNKPRITPLTRIIQKHGNDRARRTFQVNPVINVIGDFWG